MSPVEILVVEDEGLVAEDLKQTLEGLGYSVPTVCASGEAAVTTATTDRPDLVLMDIVLQGNMDGVEAAGANGSVSIRLAETSMSIFSLFSTAASRCDNASTMRCSEGK